MAHTTNRTFICSVIFLDIVEYSQKAVDEQIQLKNRLNEILTEAIKDVALNDRIILDTGDGAAISFLGDPEDALFVALSIRDAILGNGVDLTPHFSARIGINLGPVKLVQDLNGQRNLIGDGINVAQRVMSFADPGQVLVSRSYFEVISRLSQEYAKLFHYEGSRADKSVREHQVYSVYPEEKEKAPSPVPPVTRKEKPPTEIIHQKEPVTAETDKQKPDGKTMTGSEGPSLPKSQPSAWRLSWKIRFERWKEVWNGWKKILGGGFLKFLDFFRLLINRAAGSLNGIAVKNQRKMLYGAFVLAIVIVSVLVIVWRTGEAPQKEPETMISAPVAAPEITKKTAATPPVARKMETAPATKKATSPTMPKKAESPLVETKIEPSEEEKKLEVSTPAPEKQTEIAITPETPSAPPTISLGVAPWGEIYLDGQKKGVSPPLNTLEVTPGKHQIEIRNTTFPSYKKDVDLKPGENFKIKHKFR